MQVSNHCVLKVYASGVSNHGFVKVCFLVGVSNCGFLKVCLQVEVSNHGFLYVSGYATAVHYSIFIFYMIVSGFVLGELEEEATSDIMYTYKEDTDHWEQMGKLAESRALHGMCSDDQRIYVIGGRKPGQYHSSMEIFNPTTCQSTITHHLPGCRDCVYPVFQEGYIYVAGGWSLGGRMDTILVYDVHSASWREMACRLPKPVSSCGCAILILPRSLLGRALRE